MQKFTILFMIVLTLLSIDNSKADRRYFGLSYIANTIPANALEFELWNTGRLGKGTGFYYRFQPRIELEYGVTDRLTTSFNMNFNQVVADYNEFNTKSLSFETTSIELKYRFTNPGEYVVDPALYFEFGYGGGKIEYESKFIFSRRFNNWVSVFNISSELERDVIDKKLESKLEITAGLMHDITTNFALGLEFKNHRGFNSFFKGQESQASFVGPTINIQTKSFYFTFNILQQVAGNPVTKSGLELTHHEKYEFRTILGIEL